MAKILAEVVGILWVLAGDLCGKTGIFGAVAEILDELALFADRMIVFFGGLIVLFCVLVLFFGLLGK